MTALKRLTAKYGIGEAFLDRLLREHRFVDLYAVVRGGLLASEKNYSIKSMEAFYRGKREGDVTTSGGSVVAYEEWRRTGDDAILEEIRAYNEVDCVSTEELRDWLVSIRPEGPWPSLAEESAGEKEAAADERTEALRAQLAASDLPEDRRRLLFDLAQYHWREDKPVYWSVHDSIAKEEDELVESVDAVGGMVRSGGALAIKQSVGQRFTFPQQETRLKEGARPAIGYDEDGFITTAALHEFDAAAGTLTLKIGKAKAGLLENVTALHPEKPLNTGPIQDAIRAVIDDQCGQRVLRAADALLTRATPRFRSGPRADVLNDRDPVEGTIGAVMDMDGTVLPIQGPPGTGKTYVTARAILALVRAGRKVAVASTSHEAVKNVLMGILDAHEWDHPDFTIVHKLSDDTYTEDCPIQRTDKNDEDLFRGADVVGGTAWLFSREGLRAHFDHIFVDEPGRSGWPTCWPCRPAPRMSSWSETRASCLRCNRALSRPRPTCPASTGCRETMPRSGPTEGSSCPSRGGCIRTSAGSSRTRSMKDGSRATRILRGNVSTGCRNGPPPAPIWSLSSTRETRNPLRRKWKRSAPPRRIC